MGWTCNLLSLDGTSTIATATKFRSAKLNWAIDGSGSAEINLMPGDVASGAWLYGRRRVLFKDGSGTARFQGFLDRLERGGSPDSAIYRATARGLAEMLAQRVVHPAVIDLATAATTIATDIIENVTAQADDVTNFTIGTIHGTPPTRDRFVCDLTVAADAINELANLADGFSWEIDAAGKFNAWNGGRGSASGETLAPSDTTSWADVADVSELMTYATGVISDSNGCAPYVYTDVGANAADYGRREIVITDPSGITDDELPEVTTEELRARAASGSDLQVAWIEGRGPWAFGTVWLGDTVSVARGTEFGGTATMRLINVTVTLEPGHHEFVECEFELAP